MVEFPFTFYSESTLPRIDFKLTVGESPKLERIMASNAYDDRPYLRLVYRKATEVEVYGSLYILHATEVVDVTKDLE